MTTLAERTDKKRYEKAKKVQKQRRIGLAIVGIVLLVTVVVFLIDSQINKHYTDYTKLVSSKRVDSNTVKYTNYGNEMLKYSRDGASIINAKGEIFWNGSYDMKNPKAVVCGQYVAIGDIGGKQVCTYDGNGKSAKIEVVLPIIQVEVAAQGVVAIVLEDSTSNIIQLYAIEGTSGTLKVEIPTNVKTDGVPMDVSISEDGQKLVTTFVKLTEGKVESSVNFYNFGKIGQNSLDRIVGSRPFLEKLMGEVRFINNETVCVYGEREFSIYSMKQTPDDVCNKTFKKDIKNIFYNSSYVGVVLENGSGKEERYQVCVYNLKGKKILDKNVNYQYRTVELSEKEIIFFSETQCHILQLNGNEKFSREFDESIVYFYPIKGNEKYNLVDSENVCQVKLIQK